MIVYFSGTGNSRYAAETLARELNDELLDAGKEIRAGKKGILHSDRPWIFVAPTYAWRLPHIFSDYIRNAVLTGSKDAYFVLTCGGDIGNAGAYTAQLCEQTGLNDRGILEVIMPENYIAMFDAPGAEEARTIVDRAKPVLSLGAAWIRNGMPFPTRKVTPVDRMKSGIINSAFYRLFVKADSFFVTESCVGCNTCAEACPLNNITLVDGKPVWGKNCTHCMACICGCPTEAIEYGKVSRGKPRYQCPKDES